MSAGGSAFWAHVEALDQVGVGEELTLSADETRHVHTRRLREGDALVLFDGVGQLADATVESLRKKEARVQVDQKTEVPRPGSGFVLASAIPKGDRLSTMLQMLSQLGVLKWQPLVCENSAVRKLDPDAPRLRRIVLESCKVARRAWALEIAAPIGLEEAVASATGSIFFGDREGDAGGLDPRASLLVIGPEAGLTERERAQLVAAGAAPRRFGAHNLRIETAAIAGATAHHLARGSENGSDQ